MTNTKICTPHTKMSELLSDNYSMLLLLFRFNISLGVGEKSIKDICQENNVDLHTFLSIVNFILHPETPALGTLHELYIPDVIKYLSNSHSYFLDFRLPTIRAKLFSAILAAPEDVRIAIQRFFDEYVEEVRKHMQYENKIVFPYVEGLLKGESDPKYSISIFKKKHDQIEMKIMELKNILIKYYPARNDYQLNSVLYDLFSCESELADHNHVEDFLFVPAVELVEESMLRHN